MSEIRISSPLSEADMMGQWMSYELIQSLRDLALYYLLRLVKWAIIQGEKGRVYLIAYFLCDV